MFPIGRRTLATFKSWFARPARPRPVRSRSLTFESLEDRMLLTIVPINNGIPAGTVGQFGLDVDNGGASNTSHVTVQGQVTPLVSDADFIFDYINYVAVGRGGNGLDLRQTTITMQTTLVAPGVAVSAGTFAGQNGTISWRAQTSIAPGSPTILNQVTFTSAQPLGSLRLINYLDEDVFGPNDDLLRVVGTPGQPGFLAFTIDGPERVGFAQGGIYQRGPQLVNATYDGWAADVFPQLKNIITGAGTTYTIAGNINTTNLPPFTDPTLGPVFGPRDVTTAFAWSVDPNATTATVTSLLQLVPQNPGAPVSASINDVQVREGDSGTTPAVFTVTLASASILTVTMNFATADGTARAGQDYLPASGTLTFAPGVTSQTITVPVIGNTIPQPNRTFFVNLSNPTNATLTRTQGVGTILDDDGPCDPLVGFVINVYRDVLGRLPEVVGLNGWVQALRSGMGRDQVGAAIYTSIEGRTRQVDRFYSLLLGRTADPLGRTFWVNTLLRGVSEADVVAGFLTSGEYAQRFRAASDQAAYVSSLYQSVLGRNGSPGEVSSFVQLLQTGQLNRTSVVYVFLSSNEAYRSAVVQYYNEYLRRAPSSAEIDAQVAVITGGGAPNPVAFAARILGSPEYFARACTG